MAKKTIMLVCSAGMSTSLLVTKMQKAAEAKGLEADIFAVSASEAVEKDNKTYCSEACAQGHPDGTGCGHTGCDCG